MLPSIIEVAQANELIFNKKTLNKKEVRCKCPFCMADANRPKKFYLSLNEEKNVFRCWYCGLKGGVLEFEAKLTGKPYEEIKKKYFGEKKYYHPAERLSPKQLEKINLLELKKDYKQFKKSLDKVEAKWQEFVYKERVKAFAKLLIGIEIEKYQQIVEIIQKQSENSEIPSLLDDVLNMYSSSKWDQWAIEGRKYALIAYKAAEKTGTKEKALLYLPFALHINKINHVNMRKHA